MLKIRILRFFLEKFNMTHLKTVQYIYSSIVHCIKHAKIIHFKASLLFQNQNQRMILSPLPLWDKAGGHIA